MKSKVTKLSSLFLFLSSIGLFLICGGCPNKEETEVGDCNLENMVKSVSDVKGTIWFDNQSQEFCVFTGIEGTYDSQDIGIACNLTTDNKIEGLKILFSGTYYKCDDFPPLIVGQTYYFLEITKIKTLVEE